MAEKRGRREEVENGILKKVLLVTLEHQHERQQLQGGGTVVYLEQLAAELLSEGRELLLSRDVLERVLMDRLSTSTGAGLETPFNYLVGCYRRALDQGRRSQTMKDKHILAEVLITLGHVKDLCVSYAGNICQYPDMFPQPPQAGGDQRHSDLVRLILADAAPPSIGFDPGTSGGSAAGALGPALPAGFLDHFLKRFEDDGLDEIFNSVFRDLQLSVQKVSPLGSFQAPLRAMIMLVSHPPLARVLVNHPLWLPKGERVTGRWLEMHSVLGPFFHISSIPDHPVFGNGEPNVGQQCFASSGEPIKNSDVLSGFTTVTTVMHQLYDGLHEVLLKLLRTADTRESVLQYLADLIEKNARREALQANPFTNASNGMFVSLSSVMLTLCDPFIDITSPKKDKIDASYVLQNGRVDFSTLTALHATSEEVAKWVDKKNLSRTEGFRQAQQQMEQEELRRLQSHEAATSSNGLNPLLVPVRPAPEQTKYSFICECFFLTARVMNLGLMKALSDFKALALELSRQKEALSTLLKLKDNGGAPDLDNEIEQAKASVERLSQDRFCYEAQLLRDLPLMQKALSYYRLMIFWLVRLVGGFKMPLPAPCPMEFASMPEHFTEDSLDLLLFAARVPKSMEGIILDEFMGFIVMFMGSPLHVKNPYVRAKMVEVLNAWIPEKFEQGPLKKSLTTLFEGHQLALEHLVPNLLKLYVDIEFTGSHTQFYDKFNIRHNISELLEYLWDVPSHHNCWKQIAVLEERGSYLKFLNLLINDSIFLLDESLKKITELKEMEEEMTNAPEWARRTAQERQERTRVFHQQENVVRIDMTLANEDVKMLRYTSAEITAPFLLPEMVERIAFMLNYFLMQLISAPQQKALKLTNPEKYEFKPKELLAEIVDIYVHLERGDTHGVFAKTISSDGRSYRDEFFSRAANIIRRTRPHPVQNVDEFLALGAKAKAAATEAMDAEALLGDIPDEFLDPIQYTLMKDPVILPSSKTTVDRSTIQRHLLSDQTDPFNRSLLTTEMLIPDIELKARIEEYLYSHRQ